MSELTQADRITANDMVLAKDMADALFSHYPGHLWGVNVEGAQGMAYVRLLSVSGKYGFKLRLPQNYSASEFRQRVVRAGGEILERYRLRRGTADWEEINGLPVAPTGIVQGDLAA
jgi:hypothetical protein